MKRIFLVTCTIFSILHTLPAQKPDTLYPGSKVENRIPVRSVKLSLSEWIMKYPSITGAYEYKIGDRWSLEHQLGVIFNTHYTSYNKSLFQNKRGFKVATKIRRYKPLALGKRKRVYIELEAYYNRAKFDRSRVFQVECGSNCFFSQLADYETIHDEFGFRLRPGWALYITQALFLEIDFGLGVRYYDYTSKGKPERIAWDFFADPDDENAWSFSGNLSVKLGMKIK